MSITAHLRSLLESDAPDEQIFAVLEKVGRRPGEPLLLRRFALLRSFDEQSFQLLSSDLDHRPFAEFVDQPGIVASSPGSYSIDESHRAQLLSEWKDDPSLQAVAAQFLDFFKQRNSPIDILTALLFTDPAAALVEFENLYRRADEQFDLPQCGQLIQILRARNALLQDDLRAAWQNKEAYLNSRVLFVDDYYRTSAFYERKTLTQAFRTFWSAKDQWLLEIYGKGGLGKTMFLRWLIARQCIPQIEGGSIPVARLDFDSLDLSAFAAWPWLVLLPIAQQLATQLNPNPFLSLIGELQDFGNIMQRARTSGDRSFEHLRNLLSAKSSSTPIAFQSSLDQREVLIFLDTCEEPLLHRQPALRKLIEMLASIRLTPLSPGSQPSSGMRLVVSGRYRISERMPDIRRKYRLGMADPLKIESFTTEEAKTYLEQSRRMDDPALISAITSKSGGNPFSLSLFADLAQSPEGLTTKDVRAAPSNDIVYLLERIILRIPRIPVRWLVRYAVVPPALTFDFVRNVLSRILASEASGRTARDDPDRGIKTDRYILKKPWPNTRIGDLRAIWNDLCRYASDPSWISFNNDVITLQPEVVEPMRALLRHNDRIYFPLQQAAEKYFRLRAKKDPDNWAGHMAAALFHRFQREGSVAGEEWQLLLDDPRAQTAAARSEFASLILSSAFLDDRGRPRKDRKLGPLVDNVTLARAFFEAAFAALVQRLHSGRIEDPQVSNQENLIRYSAQLAAVPEEPRRKAVPNYRRRLLDAAVQIYRGDEKEGLDTLKRCLASEPDASFQLAAHVLGARASEYSSVRVAEHHLQRAVLLSRSCQSIDFPVHWINFRFAALYRRTGALLKAGQALKESLRATLDSGVAHEHAPEVFWRLTGVLCHLGKWHELADWIERTRRAVSSPAWAQSQIHFQIGLAGARLALDRYDPLRAVSLLEKIKPLRRNYETRGAWAEVFGDCASQLLDADAAGDAFRTAGFEFGQLGSVFGSALARIREANFYLTRLGDYTHAKIRPIRLKSWEVEFEEASFRQHLRPSAIQRVSWRTYFTDQSAPEAVGLRLVSQALALRKTTPYYAVSFLNALRRVEPLEARYRGLEGFASSSQSLAPDSDMIAKLHACTPTPSYKDPDFIPKALALAEARRFFGDSAGALELLHRIDRRAGDNVFLRRRVYQGIRRVEDAELPLVPYMALFELFEERFSRYPHLVAAAAVEAARWSLNVRDNRGTEHFLAIADRYLNSSRTDSIWRIRYHLLRGEIHEFNNRADEAAREYSAAQVFAIRIGNKNAESVAGEALYSALASRDRAASEASLPTVSLTPEYLTATISPEQSAWPQFLVDQHTPYPKDFLTDLAYESAAMPGFLRQVISPLIPADLDVVTVKLRIPWGPLAAVPWELAFPPPRQPHFVFRAPVEESTSETARYMQLALRAGGVALPVNGDANDEVLQSALRQMRSGLTAHEYVRMLPASPAPGGLIFRSTPVSTPGAQPSVLLIESSSQEQPQPHMIAGVDLRHVYRRKGVDCYTLPYAEPKQVFDAIRQLRPTAVHVVSGFLETSDGGVASDLGGTYSRRPLLTPERFAATMKELPADYLRPLIIVEAPLPEDPYNRGHQALLRNAFCAELAERVDNRGVLGTGLYSPGALDAFLNGLAESLSTRPTLAELTNALWAMPGAFIPPALWTSDPLLPAFF